jgi:predicted MFS family arabinose efflux permease
MTAAGLPGTQHGSVNRAVATLGVTQMISWGTTYYLPAVLNEAFRRDLGLSGTQVFSGVAITLITAALLAWPMGRLMDREGAGKSMPAGSLFLSLGLVVLGMSQGFWSYAAAWVIFGIGMSLAMSNAVFSAMTQISGQRARRGIVIIMLFGGMAATVFWPLTLWLEAQIGWRASCFTFAAVHALFCAPAHRLFLAGATSAENRQDLRADELPGQIPAAQRRLAAGLIMVAVAGNGFVSWGLDLHLIAILKDFGLSAGAAVAIAAWKGPATLMARGLDIVMAGRVSPMGSALAAGVLIPAGLGMALAFAAGLPAAVVFITVFGFGTGLMTVARATLPLSLLGSQGFAITLGRLTLPTQIVYAVSPMTVGMCLDRYGLQASLWIALAASLVSLAALLALSRIVKASHVTSA